MYFLLLIKYWFVFLDLKLALSIKVAGTSLFEIFVYCLEFGVHSKYVLLREIHIFTEIAKNIPF